MAGGRVLIAGCWSVPGGGTETSAPLSLLLPVMGHDAVAARGWIEAGKAEQPHQGQFPTRLGKCIPLAEPGATLPTPKLGQSPAPFTRLAEGWIVPV